MGTFHPKFHAFTSWCKIFSPIYWTILQPWIFCFQLLCHLFVSCTFLGALLPLSLFYLKHMVCYVFTNEIQIGINIYHKTLLQWVRFKPHSSILTNVESLTSNIRQSFQICRREKEKEENNGNDKAFCVTRKRNKY